MESDFSDKLSKLLTLEHAAAKADPMRLADMVERMSRGLGFTIALAAKGDPMVIDILMQGAEDYAHQEAVEKAAFVRLISQSTQMKEF